MEEDAYRTQRERLAAKTRLDPETGCLIWTGAVFTRPKTGKRTYGMFHWAYEESGRRRIMNAQRAAWILEHGEPGEFFVLHKCHNMLCCNVDHLYLGNHDQNMRDRDKAGRTKKGAQVYNFKRRPELMDAIKDDLRAGLSVARICGLRAISWGTFYNAVNADDDLRRIVQETKTARYSAAQKRRFG